MASKMDNSLPDLPLSNSGHEASSSAKGKGWSWNPGQPIPEANLSSEVLFKFYKEMLLIRRFEERAGQLYGMGLIGGFCHLYIGQEAVVVGLQSNLKPMDTVVTTYRDHGHMLAAGMDPKGVMSELTGRKDGYSGGKGGSMHMFSREKGFFGGHGIVGASVPIGTGLAFAHSYKKDGGINLCYFGDGAANQGQVYESFNMAALWKLPIVYVIENNKYGMGTSVERASATTELFRRGDAHGIPGLHVNGMDVTSVCSAGRKVIDYVRKGKGPVILEMKTYRYRGHSMSDPAKYRSKEELNEFRNNHDPIDQIKFKLIEKNIMDEKGLKEVDKEIKARVIDAAKHAQSSSEPDISALYTDVLLEVS